MIKTMSNLPPKLIQCFDSELLLDFLERSYKRFTGKICRLQRKKIRPQDIGKRKEFDKLAKMYLEEYERKKIEKENYETETKELAKKVSHISTTGSTMRYKRMDSTK